MTLQWRPYQWGDMESLQGDALRIDLVSSTRTLIDECNVTWALFGLICYAPGTYEVFIVLRGGKANWPIYRALHEEWKRVSERPGIRRLFAFVDPETDHGEELTKIAGMVREAFLPSWWNGEPRYLMGRVLR